MNNSSSESHICFDSSETAYVWQTFVFFLIGGFGILGNIFIIVLALKYTVKKNLHHLIINMAVADTIVVLTTFGLEIPILVDHQAWLEVKNFSGNITCKILAFFLALGMWQTLVSLFLISIERFRATKLTRRSRSYSLKQRVAALAGCWFIAIALASHELDQATIMHEESIYFCNYADPSVFAWNVTLFCVAAPIIVTIFILSIITFRRLSRLPINPIHLSEVQRLARKKRMANAIKLVLTSLILYMGCYLPEYVANMLHLVNLNLKDVFTDISCIDYNLYNYVLTCLVIANSCLSPCIYLIFMADFRKAVRKLFRRRTHIQQLEIKRNAAHDQQPEEVRN